MLGLLQAVSKSDSIELAMRAVDAERECVVLRDRCEALRAELEAERRKEKEVMEVEHSRELPEVEADKQATESFLERIAELSARLDRQTYELEQEKRKHLELAELYEKEQREKDEVLLRNAQVSQEVEIAKQELRAQHRDADELYGKTSSLEKKLKEKSQVCFMITIFELCPTF